MAAPDFFCLVAEDYQFDDTGFTPLQYTTGGTDGITAFCSSAIVGSNEFTFSLDISSQSYNEGWLAMEFGVGSSSQAPYPWDSMIFSGPTTDLFKFTIINGSEHWTFEYWNGSSWTVLHTETVSNMSVRRRYDIHWLLSDTVGVLELYLGGSLLASIAGGDTLFTADTTVDTIKFPHNTSNTNNDVRLGPLIVDSVDTRKLVPWETVSSNSGFYAEYTGPEANLDSSWGFNSSATPVQFDADGQRGSFPWDGYGGPITNAWSVEACAVIVKGKALTAPGQHLEGLVRVGSIDYVGQNSKPVLAGSESTYAYRLDFNIDPSTSLPWADPNTLDAAELGYKVTTTPAV